MKIDKFAEVSYFGMQKTVGFIVVIISVAILGLMLLTCADIVMRDVFNDPIPGAPEIAELALPYIIFGAMSYTLIWKRHVRVSLFTNRTPFGFQTKLEYPILILELLCAAWLTYAGFSYFWKSFAMREIMMSATDLPWYVGKFALPLGFALFSLGLMSQILFKIFHKSMVISKSETGAEIVW
ncbi:TRAP transporter small permease subunit [Chloroflexota bacterium]